jgi:protein SCO1/2
MTRPPPPRDQNASASAIHRRRKSALVVAIVALIGLVLLAGVAAHYWRKGETQSQRQPASSAVAAVGGPFSLIDPAGRPVTDRDFRGQFMLIYFGYTTCPNHCPTMLMMTAAALDALGPRARQVQPIFITVDPDHDTPEIMGRYTSKFSPRILGLTGSPAQIAAVEETYGVQTLFRRTGPEEGAYRIDHPSGFYLVGPDGRFIAELQSDGGADDLAARIRQRL